MLVSRLTSLWLLKRKKSRRRSSRTSKDKGRSRKPKAEVQEAAAPVEAETVPAGLEEQPEVPALAERRPHPRTRGTRRATPPKDEAIFRNSSHIPAFLLRQHGLKHKADSQFTKVNHWLGISH